MKPLLAIIYTEFSMRVTICLYSQTKIGDRGTYQ
jgi:hypothetical protein